MQKMVLTLSMALSQNGIYGANYKIAMIISMFIQAFRYASEPFFKMKLIRIPKLH